MHNILHLEQELPAQGTAGVEHGKVLAGEISGTHQGNGHSIAHGKSGRSAGSGSQPQGAGLPLHADVNKVVSMASQIGIPTAAISDDSSANTADNGQDIDYFRAFTTVGNGNDHILFSHHAQIPMKGLAWVHEESWRACAGQGCGNLPADMAGLAHASHYHPGLAIQYALHCCLKLIINTPLQGFHRTCLYLQGLYGFLRYHGHGCVSFYDRTIS